MTDTSTRVAGPQPPNPSTQNPTAIARTPIGTPLAQSAAADHSVVAARANAAGTANVQGLQSSACEAGGPVHVQSAGPLTLTAAEWDAITGQTGGLTRNAPYYLSSASAGLLTSTAPVGAGTFRVPVGFALSAETMMINVLPLPIATGS